MRAIFVGVIGLTLFVHPTFAAEAGTCSAALSELTSQWDAMAFPAPSKPSQAQVVARGGGEVISGADYQRITSEMRFASLDCQAGQEASALQRIESAKALLAADKPKGFVAERSN